MGGTSSVFHGIPYLNGWRCACQSVNYGLLGNFALMFSPVAKLCRPMVPSLSTGPFN